MNETNELIVSVLQDVRAELLGLRAEMRDGFETLSKRFDKIDALLDGVDSAFSNNEELHLGNSAT